MRAVQFDGVGDLRVEDVSDPQISEPDQVRIAVAATGICGSDVHNSLTSQVLCVDGRTLARL